MSQPKKSPFDPQSKTAKPHQSGNHPLAGSAAASQRKIPKPIVTRGGPGQSRWNLMRSDLDEYARFHGGGAAGAKPGRGLLQKFSDGFKGLLKKLTGTP
jgi:hypothetical protein